MATLTIRNLPDEVRNRIRREAAEHGRSMEEEVRRSLADRYTAKVPLQDILRKLEKLNAKYPDPQNAMLLTSEAHIADSRLGVLFDESLISLEEKLGWQARVDARSVSLDEVETFFRSKWPWSQKKS